MTFTITLSFLLKALGSLLMGVGAFVCWSMGVAAGMDAEGRGGALTLPLWVAALVFAGGAIGVWWWL